MLANDDSSSTRRLARKLIHAPLLRRDSIGDAYHVLTFDVPTGVDARPGQFCMVRGAGWGNSPLLPRPMSYLTAGSTPSILVKVVGEGTTRLARATPGERFDLLGPLGIGWREPSAGRRPILAGGGVGIAPLLFFARRLSESGRRPLVLYGGRTGLDLPMEEDLSTISDLRVTTEDGSRGARGRVTDALEAALREHEAAEVYSCGPEAMMAAVAEACADHDIPCEVSLETPMACGYGVCLGCAVPVVEGGYAYACVDGPCLDARRVVWEAP